MSRLNYRTRNQSSPQGKRKVWFCAHPDDYEKFFDKITDEILKKQNCAVWYDEEPTADYDAESLLSDLSQMNLFVMPVTAKLLNSDCRAIAVEFAYAEEHHIPVLPLMQEGGLEELFNGRCGDIQFLDPNKLDDTAISYDDKLTKFLSDVLIGDELAEKIRKAFDAYIFLSYRKKDRKYAQELMRLIHKNDFCRDIAIWYDEFLTPGENFNDSIRDALEKSCLFALAVTPNLVNEENYVMTVEYPMAKRANKQIVPAEMLETDRAELSSKYPEIPETVSAGDHGALSASLFAALSDIAIRQNDSDPEHNFFIGLAYLSGIDVEKDSARAISLITSAADAGLDEAIKKLVMIYRNGEEVRRDYERAIEWQRKLVDCRRSAYESKHDEESAEALLLSMLDLGLYIEELRRIDEAQAVYLELCRVCEEICVRFPEKWTKQSLSVCYEKLGDISEYRGDPRGAEEWYLKSLEVSEELADGTDEAKYLRDLSISYVKLGDIRKYCDDRRGAEDYYRRALSISEKLAAETDSALHRRDLSVVYGRIGDVCRLTHDIDGAEEYFLKALELRRALAVEIGDYEARRDLAFAFNMVGNIFRSKKEPDRAEEYYLESLSIREELANETSSMEALRNQMISYGLLGKTRSEMKDYDGAEKYYLKSLKLNKEIVRRAETVEALRDLSLAYTDLANLYSMLRRYHRAEDHYLKSLEIRERLAREIRTVSARRDLAICYRNLGLVRENLDDAASAEQYYLKALELRRALADETQTPQAYDALALIYYNLSFVNAETAKTNLTRAAGLWSRLAEEYPAVSSYARSRDIAKRRMETLS